eukprot:EG_transcript_5841
MGGGLRHGPLVPALCLAALFHAAAATPTATPTLALGAGLPAEDDDPAEREHRFGAYSVLAINGVLMVAVLLNYAFLKFRCHYIPESVCTISVGAILGLTLQLSNSHIDEWYRLQPETFFLFLLPPIIFESGYNLNKGNFFSNLGSISLFAVVGTLISSLVVGLGCWVFGLLPFLDALMFGALISAVDPVATLAIFQSIDVDPTVHMLVFGESVVNDAVAVVLMRTLVVYHHEMYRHNFSWSLIFNSFGLFFLNFFASAFVGLVIALLTALIFKYLGIRQYPSLEFTLMCLLCYLPYVVADVMGLSGIMSILFAGIANSHYTFFNLSACTQVTTQQTFRMTASISETLVFAYLGLAIFQFSHRFDAVLVVVSVVLCLVGRALNIFPLSAIANRYRTNIKISGAHQIIMWFSGLRGAIAFSLALSMPRPPGDDVHRKILTTTLCIVVFSILVFGGGTLPLLYFLGTNGNPMRPAVMSKTAELGEAVEGSKAEGDAPGVIRSSAFSFDYWDDRFLKPTFRDRQTALSSDHLVEEMQILADRLQTSCAVEEDGAGAEDAEAEADFSGPDGWPLESAASPAVASARGWDSDPLHVLPGPSPLPESGRRSGPQSARTPIPKHD